MRLSRSVRPGHNRGVPPLRLHANQVDIDGGLVRRLVNGQFPEYAGLPLRYVPSGGTENAVYRLGDDLAIRLPLQEDAVSGLSCLEPGLPSGCMPT